MIDIHNGLLVPRSDWQVDRTHRYDLSDRINIFIPYINPTISVLQGFSSYTGLSLQQLKLSGFLGNWESWRKGQGMSIAEIRPYQPGDTIKQIDRLSTAKKSELMTKLTHQEEQLRIMHAVWGVDDHLIPLLKTVVAGISYAALKTGDIVGALIGSTLYPASRKKTQYLQWFDRIQGSTGDDSTLSTNSFDHSVVCVMMSDFPDEEHKMRMRTMSRTNSIVLIILGHEESFVPVPGRYYAYAGADLLSSERQDYMHHLQQTLQETRIFMQSIQGKCLIVDTGSDPLAQLSKQRVF